MVVDQQGSAAGAGDGQQPSEHLNIKVTDNNNEVFFKIKRSTQLNKYVSLVSSTSAELPLYLSHTILNL